MKNIPAHRDPFQFIEILHFMHIVEGSSLGWQGIKVKFASTSIPECKVQDFWSRIQEYSKSVDNRV